MRGERETEILRITGGESERLTDRVAVEESLTVFVNGRSFVTLQYCPPMAAELAVGYLASEGIISSKDDIKSLMHRREGVYVEIHGKLPARPDAGAMTVTSGCGGGIASPVREAVSDIPKVGAGFTVSADSIFRLSDTFRKESELFESTGGVHSAALSDGENVVYFADDIGRHNAVDKVIGACLTEGSGTGDKILFITGRVSSEIIIKAGRRSIPVVASRSAPTALAVEFAERLGITLIGFLRGRRMNVYSRPERLKVS